MIKIHHLNCLKIKSPITDHVIGHCLLIENGTELTLIDTGIGLVDTQFPLERIGQDLIDIVGFQFNEELTAFKQIEKLALNPEKVTNCIVSHLDPDHIGGLADFPNAVVHVSEEEWESFKSGNTRYLQHQLDHNPKLKTYAKSSETWFGFEARKLNVHKELEVYLIPLFGHTLGHCGIAFKENNRWKFFIGDAYYMRIELTDSSHPVNELTKLRADDNKMRLDTLLRIKDFVNKHPGIEVFSYHDIEEFPKK